MPVKRYGWHFNDNQVVAVETLKVKKIIRNPQLAKHIADVSWGEFARQLEYKAQWADRTLIKIDQWYLSSKPCPLSLGRGVVKDLHNRL